MLSGDGNKNSQKKSVGLISKKTTLQVQHTFFVHFFAVVLHNYNVLRRKCCMCSFCSLSSRYNSFSPWWPLALLHFLTAAIKFSCYSSNVIGLLCLLSLALALSVINVDIIKIKSKERIGFVVVVVSISKSLGGYAIYHQNAQELSL